MEETLDVVDPLELPGDRATDGRRAYPVPYRHRGSAVNIDGFQRSLQRTQIVIPGGENSIHLLRNTCGLWWPSVHRRRRRRWTHSLYALLLPRNSLAIILRRSNSTGPVNARRIREVPGPWLIREGPAVGVTALSTCADRFGGHTTVQLRLHGDGRRARHESGLPATGFGSGSPGPDRPIYVTK